MAQKAKQTTKQADPVVKALQEELKQQGFFPYEVDGLAGEKTSQAVTARDAALAQKQQGDAAAKQAEAALKTAQGDAALKASQAAGNEVQIARDKLYQEQEGSPEGIAAQIGATGPAPIIAGAVGLKAGDKINQYFDRGQELRNGALRGAAADRVSGLTTRKGAIEGIERAGAMPSKHVASRVASRLAPHLALGGIAMGKGAHILNNQDENQGFYPEMSDRAQGLGWIGFGSGLAKKGIQYAANPGVSPDSQALAVINSEGLRRGGPRSSLAQALEGDAIDITPRQEQAALPPPSGQEKAGPTPGSKAHLVEQAKGLGLKGTSRMNKSQLAEALSEALSEHGTKRTRAPKKPPGALGALGPALAAGTAFMATPDAAEASDGTQHGGTGEALTNAAAAGGIAGGTGYGISKLAQALGPMAGPAAAGAGSMLGPMSTGDMTDDFASPEARNFAARNLPEALQFGAVDEARQMATVPEPNPQRQAGEGGYSPNVSGRLNRMIQLGAPPETIANFLNEAVR